MAEVQTGTGDDEGAGQAGPAAVVTVALDDRDRARHGVDPRRARGHDRRQHLLAFTIGAALMIAAGLVEVFLGVNAERKSLEDIARPPYAAYRNTSPAERSRAPVAS
jgi:hypothetical protein